MKTPTQILLPSAASYVRSGNFSSKNASEINASLGLPEEMLIFKHAPGSDWDRYLLAKFNIEELEGKHFRLCVRMSSFISVAETDVLYQALPLDFEGDITKLTYDTLPPMGEAVGSAYLGGFGGCDISEYIAKAKAEGKKELYFAVYATRYTDVELRLTNPTVKGNDICIKAFNEAQADSYVKDLTGDEAKDAEIWAWAEKIYAEWREHYDEMMEKPPLDAELIQSPEEQYTDEVWFSSSSKTFDNAKKAAKTRLVSSLTDIDEYAPAKDIPVNEFGGLVDESRRQEATGFFYVKKIGKRFWVIDPKGYPCVIRALSQVVPNYQGSVYQMERTLEKFGTLENWGNTVAKRLKEDLHFFASASPDPHAANSSYPLIRQQAIGFAYQYGRTIGTANSKGGSSEQQARHYITQSGTL